MDVRDSNTSRLHNWLPYPFSLPLGFYRYIPFPSGISKVRWWVCSIFERAMRSGIFATWQLPIKGIWKRLETSSKLISISPNRRWKEDVSLCHRSTKEGNSGSSSMVREHSTNESRLTSTSISMTSYGIYTWYNFFNFVPWEGTFSGVRPYTN